MCTIGISSMCTSTYVKYTTRTRFNNVITLTPSIIVQLVLFYVNPQINKTRKCYDNLHHMYLYVLFVCAQSWAKVNLST